MRWRNWRRTRFRTTAPPTTLLTTNPARTGAAAGTGVRPEAGAAVGTAVTVRSRSWSKWTTRRVRPARRPRRTAAAKSVRRRNRDADGNTSGPGFGVRPKGPCGPFGDGQRGWRGRRAYASATGTRGSSRDGGCSAGTCACSLGGSRGIRHRKRCKFGYDKIRGGTFGCGCCCQRSSLQGSLRGSLRQVTRTYHGTGRQPARSNRSHERRRKRGLRSKPDTPTGSNHETTGCGELLEARPEPLLASDPPALCSSS